MRQLTLSLFLIFITVVQLCAQRDTEFWFAVPNFSNYNAQGVILDRPAYINITSYNTAVIVTIKVPATNNLLGTVNIPANSTSRFEVTNNLNNIEVSPANAVTNQGLQITSTAPISAYYEIASAYSPELFSLKGKNALGTNFMISSENIGNNNATLTPNSYNTINIVAKDDNTAVTITPSKNVIGHAANIPYTVNLNKGQTYAAQSSSNLGTQHLDGSTVTSTKPVAVTIGDDNVQASTYGTCSDNCGDQTVPINIIGKEYVAVPATLNAPYDKVFVTATQNNTTVAVGGVMQATINAGQTHLVTLTNNQPAYIVTSQPAYAYIFTGFGCEFGTAVLPQVNCTGSKEVSVLNSGIGSSTATLVIKSGFENNFTLNGNPLSASFSSVPGTSNAWKFAKVNTSGAGSLVNIKNSASEFLMGFIQGGPGTGCSVGYFSDFGSFSNPITANTIAPCQGGALNLTTSSISGATFAWNGPNAATSTTNSLNISNVAANNTGWYYLTTTTVGACVARDSIYVTVGPPPTNTVVDSTVCEGTTVYGYTATGTYSNTFTNAAGCDSIRVLNLTVKPKSFTTINQQICNGQSFLGYTATGTYIATFTAANGCDSVRTVNLTVVNTINTNVFKTICLGQSYLGYTATGTYTNNFISTGGCDSIRTLHLVVKPPQFTTENKTICEGQSYFGFTITGTHVLNLFTAEGCDSTHTINLTVKPRRYSNISQSICEGTSYLGYSVAGTYNDTLVSSIGCDSVRTLNLTIKPKSFNTINKTICEGQSFMGFNTSGTYTATLLAANGCDSVLTIILSVTATIRSTINKTICQGQAFEGYTTAGTYTDRFTSAITNCDSLRTLVLTVQTIPIFTLGPNKDLCIGDSLILNPGNFLSYQWQNGSTANTFIVKNAGLYKVTVSNLCGSSSSQVTITTQPCNVYFPTIFTPNTDGVNDVFKALNVGGISKYDLKIYNRWGLLVFQTTNSNQEWRGTYNQKPQPNGAYVVVCQAIVNTKPFYYKNTLVLTR